MVYIIDIMYGVRQNFNLKTGILFFYNQNIAVVNNYSTV